MWILIIMAKSVKIKCPLTKNWWGHLLWTLAIEDSHQKGIQIWRIWLWLKGRGTWSIEKKINKKGSVNFICFFLLQRKCWLSLNCVLGTWAPDINCRNIGKLINSIHEMERCEKRVYSAIHGKLLYILNSISTNF